MVYKIDDNGLILNNNQTNFINVSESIGTNIRNGYKLVPIETSDYFSQMLADIRASYDLLKDDYLKYIKGLGDSKQSVLNEINNQFNSLDQFFIDNTKTIVTKNELDEFEKDLSSKINNKIGTILRSTEYIVGADTNIKAKLAQFGILSQSSLGTDNNTGERFTGVSIFDSNQTNVDSMSTMVFSADKFAFTNSEFMLGQSSNELADVKKPFTMVESEDGTWDIVFKGKVIFDGETLDTYCAELYSKKLLENLSKENALAFVQAIDRCSSFRDVDGLTQIIGNYILTDNVLTDKLIADTAFIDTLHIGMRHPDNIGNYKNATPVINLSTDTIFLKSDKSSLNQISLGVSKVSGVLEPLRLKYDGNTRVSGDVVIYYNTTTILPASNLIVLNEESDEASLVISFKGITILFGESFILSVWYGDSYNTLKKYDYTLTIDRKNFVNYLEYQFNKPYIGWDSCANTQTVSDLTLTIHKTSAVDPVNFAVEDTVTVNGTTVDLGNDTKVNSLIYTIPSFNVGIEDKFKQFNMVSSINSDITRTVQIPIIKEPKPTWYKEDLETGKISLQQGYDKPDGFKESIDGMQVAGDSVCDLVIYYGFGSYNGKVINSCDELQKINSSFEFEIIKYNDKIYFQSDKPNLYRAKEVLLGSSPNYLVDGIFDTTKFPCLARVVKKAVSSANNCTTQLKSINFGSSDISWQVLYDISVPNIKCDITYYQQDTDEGEEEGVEVVVETTSKEDTTYDIKKAFESKKVTFINSYGSEITFRKYKLLPYWEGFFKTLDITEFHDNPDRFSVVVTYVHENTRGETSERTQEYVIQEGYWVADVYDRETEGWVNGTQFGIQVYHTDSITFQSIELTYKKTIALSDVEVPEDPIEGYITSYQIEGQTKVTDNLTITQLIDKITPRSNVNGSYLPGSTIQINVLNEAGEVIDSYENYYNGDSWQKGVKLYVHGNAIIDGTLSVDSLKGNDGSFGINSIESIKQDNNLNSVITVKTFTDLYARPVCTFSSLNYDLGCANYNESNGTATIYGYNNSDSQENMSFVNDVVPLDFNLKIGVAGVSQFGVGVYGKTYNANAYSGYFSGGLGVYSDKGFIDGTGKLPDATSIITKDVNIFLKHHDFKLSVITLGKTVIITGICNKDVTFDPNKENTHDFSSAYSKFSDKYSYSITVSRTYATGGDRPLDVTKVSGSTFSSHMQHHRYSFDFQIIGIIQ